MAAYANSSAKVLCDGDAKQAEGESEIGETHCYGFVRRGQCARHGKLSSLNEVLSRSISIGFLYTKCCSWSGDPLTGIAKIGLEAKIEHDFDTRQMRTEFLFFQSSLVTLGF